MKPRPVRGFLCLRFRGATVRYWPVAACQKLNFVNERTSALGAAAFDQHQSFSKYKKPSTGLYSDAK
jgi:hypothetical protein